MNRLLIILTTIALVLASCQDDTEQELTDAPLSFCIHAGWQSGKTAAATRAYSDGFIAGGHNLITIAPEYYPNAVEVRKQGEDVLFFTLKKSGKACPAHPNYWEYTPSIKLTGRTIAGLTFVATASIDNGMDVLRAEVTEDNIVGGHLQFDLKHTKALVRFAFKVTEKYDQIRYIKIKSVKLGDAEAIYPDAKTTVVLKNDDYEYLNYIYVDPTKVTAAQDLTLSCTYDIYDKDADFTTMSEAELAMHRIREDVTNANTFRFNNLKDTGGNSISTISAGKYYDLNIIINPDFLYSMSNHDDKSGMKIQ